MNPAVMLSAAIVSGNIIPTDVVPRFHIATATLCGSDCPLLFVQVLYVLGPGTGATCAAMLARFAIHPWNRARLASKQKEL